jgi:hypothetical protein
MSVRAVFGWKIGGEKFEGRKSREKSEEKRRKIREVKRRVEDIRAIPLVLNRGMCVRVYEVLLADDVEELSHFNTLSFIEESCCLL